MNVVATKDLTHKPLLLKLGINIISSVGIVSMLSLILHAHHRSQWEFNQNLIKLLALCWSVSWLSGGQTPGSLHHGCFEWASG